VEDYGSAISTYLSLKKATSLYRHPTIVGQQKTICTEEVELAQSHLDMVRTNLDAIQERHRSVVPRIFDLKETLHGAQEEECQLKRDVEAKSLELQAANSEVEVKSKALIDFAIVPTLSPDDVMEMERREQAMLDIQSSLSLDMWMDNA